MKKLLSILIATFFLSNIVTYAQKENNPFTEIALTQAKRKDPISKGDTPISRSIIQTANAYLYNNTVCVDFNEVLPNVTITLINDSFIQKHTMNPQTLTSLWMKDTVVVTI